ncbi:MAG TPA: ComEA family DNA-binding protein [Candidatus Eisenbacteria bacterium]|nr:ComEA family DNA-binding protein [Candidatus Eisenbacteria bacterium]
MDSLSEKVFDFLYAIPKSYYLPFGIFLCGLILLSIGLMQLSNSHNQSNSQQVAAEESSKASASATIFGMQVDVEGAVVHPGVYKLSQNARVQDALIAAGGLSASADREVVAKSLNLAAKLADGVKIYVPKLGEVAVQSAGSSDIAQGTVLGAATGSVNINTASADQLDSLPGIGPVTAQKIINARPFSSVDDVLAKKAVTNSVFQKIKDKITAY